MSWFFQSKVAGQAVGHTAAAVVPAVGNVAWICNTGTKDARIAFSATDPGNAYVIPSSAVIVAAGTCRALAMSGPQGGALAQFLLAMCGGSDTTTLDIEFGQGDPTIYTIPT